MKKKEFANLHLAHQLLVTAKLVRGINLLCCLRRQDHGVNQSKSTPCIMSVQYTGGCSVRQEDIIEYTGGYH